MIIPLIARWGYGGERLTIGESTILTLTISGVLWMVIIASVLLLLQGCKS